MDSDLSPVDRDLLTRTVIGEAGNDASAPAVAHVVLNRLQSGQYGDSIPQVLLAPNQFEAWSNPRKLLSYSSQSPEYQQAAAVVDQVLAGGKDPTNGATKYYSPSVQAALGRKPPKWDDGTGQTIGSQRFFGGKPADDFLQDFPIAPSTPSGTSGAPAVAAPSTAPGDADFLKDFEVAPAASTAAPSSPPALTGPLSGASSVANASATGFASGIPIIGPYLNAGLDRGVAGIMSLATGKPYADALAAEQGRQSAAVAAHPLINAVSGVAGGVAGTAPLVAAAPEAFGISEAPLAINALVSAGSGGAIGAADAAARSGLDRNAILQGGAVGAGAGFIGPFAGKAIGSGVNALSNAIFRTTPAARSVANALADAGMSPADATNALRAMGPNATLADIDPALTDEAGGLASMGGAPTSILKNAMAARAAAADNRVSQAVTTALGPKPDLTAATEAIENDAATRAGPAYAAGRNGPPMDVTPILSNIDSQLPHAAGGVANVLNTVKSYLTNRVASAGNPTGLLVPKDNPASILQARQALDDLLQKMPLDTSAGRNAMRVASDLRNQLDQVVKTNPNFAQGDAIYSQSMGIRDALQQGVDTFKNSTRPEDMQRAIQAMSPEQLDAFRQGARVAIGDAMENSRQGEASAAQGMFARGTANRQKLDALFPNAQDVFDMLHGEAAMRATEQQVARNSATAGRRAIQQKYAPQPGNALSAAPAVIGEAIGGGPGAIGLTAGKALYGHVTNALQEAALNRLKLGMARGLVATGPEQQNFLGQVARAHGSNALTNALSKGGSIGANLLTRGGGNALQQYLSQHQ